MSRTIFFDFDGTLVDSAPGILAGYQLVLESENIVPKVVVDTSLIGPPLAPTLSRITGETDPERLARLVECFKAAYDSEGYKATRAYPGLTQMLIALKDAGHNLMIVTNKRRIPTVKTLQWLEIESFFSAVYTPDTWQPPLSRKNDTLQRALAENQLDAATCVMVGDSGDDADAAADHTVAFVAASYGYGDAASQTRHPVWATIHALSELPAILQAP